MAKIKTDFNHRFTQMDIDQEMLKQADDCLTFRENFVLFRS